VTAWLYISLRFMKKVDKALLLIMGAGILINLVKQRFFTVPKNELIVAGHHVPRQPCIGAMNILFGKAVDSSRMCDCIIPRMYELIKNDSVKMQKYEEIGFLLPEGLKQDSATSIFSNCILEAIIDTTAKLDIGKFKLFILN
jgi:hypothetical protein